MPSGAIGRPSSTDAAVDALAVQFLHPPYAGDTYADWSLDRCLDGFLRHRGLLRLLEAGDAYGLILGRVMSYIGVLHRQR
ncbi:MAG TPA: hypothetical protein VME67_03370 [Mycobacterium sp.]|nr:hypothetical protein [Mycobacterium sp.]HTX93947.1 hypothetical protein [Mycobacterium sp.]